MDIGRFLAPHSAEARANVSASESLDWDHIDETVIALCASYRSFEKYLSGEDIFIHPRTRRDLESVLRRYSTNAIHNTIAKSRTPLEPGGYSRLCHLASESIAAVLDSGDNVAYLLNLHASKTAPGPTRSASTT